VAERSYRRYISREQCKRAYAEMTPLVTEKDTKLDAMIDSASRWIEEATRTFFYPVIETRYYDHPDDATILKFDQWLLSVTTFTTSNGDETVSSDDYFLMCGKTYNIAPYDRIVMKSDGDRTTLLYSGTVQQANAITGAWGYCNDYVNTGTTLGAAITSTTTTTVTVADGTAIEVGWLLVIDDEQMFVSNISDNTLTVVRDQGGTDAAEHDNSTAVYRYVPPHDIEALCGILVARLFHRGSTSWADTVGAPERGVIFVKEAPSEARAIIERYKRRW